MHCTAMHSCVMSSNKMHLWTSLVVGIGMRRAMDGMHDAPNMLRGVSTRTNACTCICCICNECMHTPWQAFMLVNMQTCMIYKIILINVLYIYVLCMVLQLTRRSSADFGQTRNQPRFHIPQVGKLRGVIPRHPRSKPKNNSCWPTSNDINFCDKKHRCCLKMGYNMV